MVGICGTTLTLIGALLSPPSLSDIKCTTEVPYIVDMTAVTSVPAIRIQRSSNVTVKGGTWYIDKEFWGGTIYIQKSDNINVIDPIIFDKGTSFGINIRDSSNVSVSGARISRASVGMSFLDSSNITAKQNTIFMSRIDGMDFGSVQNAVVEWNTISGGLLTNDQHPDGIQVWSNPNKPISSDLSFKFNVITGSSQGISGFDKTEGYRNITVENNKIFINYPNGIYWTHVAGDLLIRNNEVRTLPGAKYGSFIYTPADQPVIRCGNYIGPRPTRPEVIEASCQ